MRTTRSKEFGLQLSCEKNKCIWRHAEDGVVVPMTGPGWQERWDDSTLLGHACIQVTREVTYGPWEKAE